MRRIAVLIALLVLVFVTEVLADGSFVIKGYEPKKFAVDDDKIRQINTGFSLIEKDPAKKPGSVLKVLVIGSADITGPSAENDLLSKERAEPVAAILDHRLPEGTAVRAVPRGDDENARQVRVEWKYVSIPPVATTTPETKASAKEFFSVWMWAIGIAIISIIVGVFVFWFHRVVSRISKTKDELKSRKQWLEIESNGRIYAVRISYGHGTIVSPFKTKSGFQITKQEKDLKGMVDSLKGCLKKEEFLSQKEELVKKRIIRIIDIT